MIRDSIATRKLGLALFAGSTLFATGAIAFSVQDNPGTAQANPAVVDGKVADRVREASGVNKPTADTAPIVASEPGDRWWSPGEGRVFKASTSFSNDFGRVGLLNISGDVNTKGHPFFEAYGTSGRACVTCHQPSDGMGLSKPTIQKRWQDTQGRDPLFAAIDGSNCPSLPQGERSSHSLLLDHGLIRMYLAWPPKNPDGGAMVPEFDIEVVKDPSTCNLDPKYGIAASGTISVFRRPRAVANMRFISASYAMRGARGRRFNNKTGLPLAINPVTGQRVGLPIMSDGRQPTLRAQASEAAVNHMQYLKPFTADELAVIDDFQNQLVVAQNWHKAGGKLGGKGGPPGLGPEPLATARPHVSGNNWRTPVFENFDAWEKPELGENKTQRAFRESVRRGYAIFTERPLWIRDVAHFNTIGMGNPYKRNCTICHSLHMVGTDTTPGVMDIGLSNKPWSPVQPHLPLFKVTCKATVRPHPYIGRVIYTHDPGRALITGQCEDVGSLVMQQMRGLGSRAPYFANGAAANLEELVDFYDRRFAMNLTKADKADLVNFLTVL